jgi:hypothetical protein
MLNELLRPLRESTSDKGALRRFDTTVTHDLAGVHVSNCLVKTTTDKLAGMTATLWSAS